MHNDFHENLKLLSSYYRSISDICRRLNINRQQYNKYLSGKTRPSRHNLNRICAFFGIDESDILLPHQRFKEIVNLRPRTVAGKAADAPPLRHLQRLMAKGAHGLEPYVGYYFRYFYSYGFPGQIVKSLFGLFRKEDYFYTKNLGMLLTQRSGRTYRVRFKYLGLPLLINDRIFLVEYESALEDMISETILYPAYRNRVDILVGLQCTVSGERSREPAAGRVAFEFIGRAVDARRALRHCGLFGEDSEAIPPSIRQQVRNEIAADRGVLLAYF